MMQLNCVSIRMPQVLKTKDLVNKFVVGRQSGYSTEGTIKLAKNKGAGRQVIEVECPKDKHNKLNNLFYLAGISMSLLIAVH